jgi:hypothetical protein
MRATPAGVRAIVHHQEQCVGVFDGAPGAFHAHGFDRVAGRSDTGGVHHVHGEPVQLNVLAQHISRGARNVGDDGGVAAGQEVQEARLADVGLAGEHHPHAFLQQHTAIRTGAGRRQHLAQAGKAFLELGIRQKVDLLLGKVDAGLDECPRLGECVGQLPHAIGERAVEGAHGGAGRGPGAAVDEIRHRLRPGEIHASVEEGPLGKLPRPRRPCARPQRRLQHHIHDNGSAVTL